MADQPVTREKLINADIDVENFGKAMNEFGVVNPRYGEAYPTLPSAIQKVIETGGFEPFQTESALKASTPTLTKKAAYALDTHKIWLWQSNAWIDTGLSAIDQAKAFANSNSLFNPSSVPSSGVDLNSLVTFGFHKFLSAAAWDASTNKPTGVSSQWAVVLVLPLSPTVVFQIVFGFNSKKLNYRYSTNLTNWSTWETVSGDVFTANAITKAVGDYSAQVRPEFTPGSKNIFNPESTIPGKVINTSGALVDATNGVITGLIDVSAGTVLSVSGLQASVAYRAIRFLNADNVYISTQSIAPALVQKAFTLPAGAKYAQMCLKENADTFALDVNTIQFELAAAPTSFTPYIKGNLVGLFGAKIKSESSSASKAIGAKYLIFGDSITQTSPVDSGIFDQTTSPFPNWPTYAKEQLQMSVFRNYAKSGASFRNRNIEHLQFLKNQVDLAISNNEVADVIVVACGTNDGLTSLGTYESAMSKTTLEDLDLTLGMEAARWAFWKLRLQYPDAVCFYCNPLQRMSNTVEELAPLVDGLSKLAQRHGFILIDQNKESGIIRELEVLNGEGKYLADGLHPNTAGRKRQANMIVSKIKSSMMY